jgi:hypothetical protein
MIFPVYIDQLVSVEVLDPVECLALVAGLHGDNGHLILPAFLSNPPGALRLRIGLAFSYSAASATRRPAIH